MGRLAYIAAPIAAIGLTGPWGLGWWGTAGALTAAQATSLAAATGVTADTAILGMAGAGAALPTWVSPALTIAGSGFNALSAIHQGNALRAAGEAEQLAANSQALHMEAAAGQERARAQRVAAEERRKAALVGSRAQALGAAGGTTGKGVFDVMGGIAAEGDYRARLAGYEGETAAQGLELGAMLKRYGGTQAAAAGNIARRTALTRAGTTLAESVESELFRKYR